MDNIELKKSNVQWERMINEKLYDPLKVGDRISFGENFYANTGLTILDENYVTFGDNVFIGPHASIYTAGHPIDA